MAIRGKKLHKHRPREARLLATGEVVAEQSGEAVPFEHLISYPVSIRLGPGYVEPVDERNQVSGLRNLFLERVRQHEFDEERAAGKMPPRKPLRVLRRLAEIPYREFLNAKVDEEGLFLLLEEIRRKRTVT